jgi:uncharacterized protein (DUF983 family)
MSVTEQSTRSEATSPTGVTTATAIWRGFSGHCPHCGKGRLFRAFLKVADQCPACGEALHHHRADDFPAYIVIVIVGHIMVPLMLLVETHFAPPTWVHMTLWPTAVLVLGLALLQPVKGAVVGLQWQLGMHGFEQAKAERDALAAGG